MCFLYLYRQEGLEYEVLQWYICRMEAWFAADVDTISLKNWDQVIIFRNGYHLQKSSLCIGKVQVI